MPPRERAGTAPQCRWAASPGLLRRSAGTAGGGSPTPSNRASRSGNACRRRQRGAEQRPQASHRKKTERLRGRAEDAAAAGLALGVGLQYQVLEKRNLLPDLGRGDALHQSEKAVEMRPQDAVQVRRIERQGGQRRLLDGTLEGCHLHVEAQQLGSFLDGSRQLFGALDAPVPRRADYLPATRLYHRRWCIFAQAGDTSPRMIDVKPPRTTAVPMYTWMMKAPMVIRAEEACSRIAA